MSVSELLPMPNFGTPPSIPSVRFVMPVAAVLICWAGPATAAGTAHATMSVGATVVSTCTISTESHSATTGPVSHSCSNFSQGSVSIAREPAASGLPALPVRQAAPAQAGDTAPRDGVRYITVTY